MTLEVSLSYTSVSSNSSATRSTGLCAVLIDILHNAAERFFEGFTICGIGNVLVNGHELLVALGRSDGPEDEF